MGSCTRCPGSSWKRDYVAIDPLTGDCLVYDEEVGECTGFRNSAAAKQAALDAGFPDAGVRSRRRA